MIHLRKNPFSETSIEIPFTEGEQVSSLVDRVILTNGYDLGNRHMRDHFQVIINGYKVEKEFWAFTEIKEGDTVLVAPIIARGAGGQLFKQIAGVVLVVVGSLLLGTGIGSVPGAGLQGAGLALATAAVAIGTSIALNALIPPPALPGLGGLGSTGSSFEGSQMYTITGQSNNAKKYGYVPKVYGTHRIFPIIATNPYTEIEADPDTGALVQFFYAIYDFGFGPLEISDIKIGDTSISEYADADYRLVDLKKPAVSEGVWDEVLYDNFQFYKGDVERDGTVVAIDKNQTDSGATLEDYQVVRTASSKVDGADQEISLDFICPQGLIAYAANGTEFTRSIDLKIEFSKIGEDVWRSYNDLDYVYDFGLAGGSTVFSTYSANLSPLSSTGVGNGYTLLSATSEILWNRGSEDNNLSYAAFTDHDGDPDTLPIRMVKAIIESYGYKQGDTKILLKDGDAVSRDSLIFSGNVIGVVDTVTASPYSGYSWYNLVEPLKNSIILFQIRKRYVESQDTSTKPATYSVYLFDGKFITSSSLTNKISVKHLSSGVARISAKNSQSSYATFKFKPKEKAQYKVRITRTGSSSGQSYRVFDKLTLTSLTTRFDRTPILTDKRHVFLEVRIRATNQLNGAISNLSAIAESVLDVYDPDTSSWVKQKTNNPAWVFADLISGSVNKKALSKDRLHVDSLLEWADFCDEVPLAPASQSFILSRFSCNFVLDFDTTLQSILNSVCNAAQASLNIIDGKYGVLIDKLKTTPVQIFTPRNSTGFSSTRNYNDAPHALTIRYIDPFKNWDVAEATVYDNGYDEDTATVFDELSTFACTNYEQAWRFGRYMLAQARLRREVISIDVDFEHIVCTRGDFVQITQDVMKVGGRPARVKSVVGNVIKIDDGIDTLPDVDYGYVYRNPVAGIKTSTLTVIDSDEFELDGDIPEPGDLIIIGEVGHVVFDCIVRGIFPSSDLTATLELVEKADDVYDAESSDTLPLYNPQLTLNVDSALATPPAVEDLVVTDNSWRVVGGAYQYYVDIDWDLPKGAATDSFEVYVNNGKGYKLVEVTQNSFYEYIVNKDDLDVEHGFKVLAVSSTGKKLTLFEASEVFATPATKTARPSNVSGLTINITNQIIQLDWPAVTDSDLAEYIVRYSPKTEDATWESSLSLLKTDKNTTLASTQGRTGTYFIKARDLNGNESQIAAQALTSIPKLFDLNIIEETNDFPDLLGQLVTVEKTSGALVLKRIVSGGFETNAYYSEGYYYYKDFLDLGEIYTVRLQSLIEAEGFTVGDLMSEWDPLSDVIAMSNAGQADWDVEAQYRTTDSFNVMSDWLALSDIDPISEGVQDNWTPWKKFIMGDATGRIFQFRLRLSSNVASVSPRVFDGVIKADMPDRLESYNNQISTLTGLEILYDPPFKGPGTTPNIQVTLENGEPGDYVEFDYKSLNGFKITIYDKNDVAVVRQFDAAVKGYGRKASAVI
jgi:hypothetical protein